MCFELNIAICWVNLVDVVFVCVDIQDSPTHFKFYAAFPIYRFVALLIFAMWCWGMSRLNFDDVVLLYERWRQRNFVVSGFVKGYFSRLHFVYNYRLECVCVY